MIITLLLALNTTHQHDMTKHIEISQHIIKERLYGGRVQGHKFKPATSHLFILNKMDSNTRLLNKKKKIGLITATHILVDFNWQIF